MCESHGIVRIRQMPREVGGVQLDRNRPYQTGSGQPNRIERRIDRQVDAEQTGKFDQSGRKQMEQRRIVFVVRPQMGGGADALVEDLANEVVVRGRVDLMQRIRPSGGTVRKPDPYDRGGDRDADDGADEPCDARQTGNAGNVGIVGIFGDDGIVFARAGRFPGRVENRHIRAVPRLLRVVPFPVVLLRAVLLHRNPS